MDYLYAFLIGGAICVIAQVLIDKTKLAPAKIVVLFVTMGVLLTSVGVYQPLVEFAGAGATVPITGFGYSLAKGVENAVRQNGWLGIFTGGFTASAGGVAAAVFFGYIFSLISNPKMK